MKRRIARALYPLAFWLARWCATNDHEKAVQPSGSYSYGITAIGKDGREMGGDGPISWTK